MNKRLSFVALVVLASLLMTSAFALAAPAAQGEPTAKPTRVKDPADRPNKQKTPAPPQKTKVPGPGGRSKTLYTGTITAVEADSLTLTLKDGGQVTVELTSATRYKGAGQSGVTVGALAHVAAAGQPPVALSVAVPSQSQPPAGPKGTQKPPPTSVPKPLP
jgi:hypothetical protein